MFFCKMAPVSAAMLLVSAVVAAAGTPDLTVAETEDGFRAVCGDRPVFQYRDKHVKYKPYVSQLWTPSGINVLRDSPHDHVHHHALMLAMNVDDAEFWAEEPAAQIHPGSQITRTIETVKFNGGPVGIQSKLDWVTFQKQCALQETRMVTTCPVAEDVTVLWWSSVLAAGPDRRSVTLTGQHYHGLGMRFVPAMDHGGRFFTSTGRLGAIIRGDERNTPCRWCAYTAKADGKPVTVAVLDHPDNYRPMVAFTMGDHGGPFAYLAATLNLWKEPKSVAADKPLSLRWGVALWDGEVGPDRVEQVYRRWLEKAHLPSVGSWPP